MRSILSLLAVAALSLSVAPQSAEAGLFGGFKHKASCCDPCSPEPSCCAPAPTCCAPAPTCCVTEPVCCEPAPCCDPCSKPRCGLFSGMLKKCFRRRAEPCCPAPEPCCAPAPVSCCAPAAPSCAAPAPCCGL